MNESNTNQLYSDEIDSIFISLNESSPSRVILTLLNKGEKRATIIIPPPSKYGGDRKEVRLIPGEPQEIVYDNIRTNYCWRIIKLTQNANLVNLCEIDMSKIQEGTPIPEPTQLREEPAPYISDISPGTSPTELQPLSSVEQPEETATPEKETIEENRRESDAETWRQIQQIHQQAQALVSEISDARERVIDLYDEMEEICRSSSRLYKALQRTNKRAKQIFDEIQHIYDEAQAESTVG